MVLSNGVMVGLKPLMVGYKKTSLISSFKPVILFGVLMGVTMTATTIGALLVLPSVIKFTGVELEKRDTRGSVWRFFDLGRIFGLESENN